MSDNALSFYATPAAMTELPDHPALAACPTDLDELRRCVQGLLVHRDWAASYGIAADAVRIDEQQLRSTRELLGRAFELSDLSITVTREPIDRVLCICRHFTMLHTALLRAQGVPARVRCGFSNYFDRSKWYDHWITERWNGGRWVRDDPQIDQLQASAIHLDFDPYDQPPGQFLDASEAWRATRAGDLDETLFGIFDMWGSAFIAGNVLTDLACLNKVELLPWDSWGMRLDGGPYGSVADEAVGEFDRIAGIVSAGDFGSTRSLYLDDDRLRVPTTITTVVEGAPRPVEIRV